MRPAGDDLVPAWQRAAAAPPATGCVPPTHPRRYPLLKGSLSQHQLILQVDGPFANAGVFYVQNVRPGDGAAWVLSELNRRIGVRMPCSYERRRAAASCALPCVH